MIIKINSFSVIKCWSSFNLRSVCWNNWSITGWSVLWHKGGHDSFNWSKSKQRSLNTSCCWSSGI